MRTFSEASAPPVHQEQTHRAWLLGRVVWTTAGTATVFLGLVLLTHPELAVRATTALVTVNLGCLVAFALNRRGHSRLASVLLVGCLVALVTGLAFSAGGIRSPGAGMYLVFVLMAGMLLGHRAGVATALVCASLGLFLVILEATGRLPRQTTHYDAVTFWLLHCLYMGVVLGLLRLTTNTIETALRRAEHLVVDLGKRVKELRALHAASRLLQRDHHFERAVLEELVRLLPPAFLHPDCCEARVCPDRPRRPRRRASRGSRSGSRRRRRDHEGARSRGAPMVASALSRARATVIRDAGASENRAPRPSAWC